MHLITAAKFRDEQDLVFSLLADLKLGSQQCQAIENKAVTLVETVREKKSEHSMLDLFLNEFGLDNDEGVALMCLSEALLRVPDPHTIDALIADKVLAGDWEEHLGGSESMFVNASTWGLLLTGKVIGFNYPPKDTIKRMIGRLGEPVIRQAVRRSMHILGNEFVLGRNIKEAITRGKKLEEKHFSFDMLGEGARDDKAATTYHKAYKDAIKAIAKDSARCGISVKLSALHARYQMSQRDRVHKELYPRLLELVELAAENGVSLSIDAEEADRLTLSLELFERLAHENSLEHYSGLGLVIQAYGKSALPLISWLKKLAQASKHQFPVRLVKGAYWDMEIKQSQVLGLPDFPVFTRKQHSDLSYILCAEKLLSSPSAFFPQFATHNAHTIAAVMSIAGSNRAFEFQRLHGMGVLLYKTAIEQFDSFPGVRVYAPVGGHRELLAYLVRRLLENGANSSFVNRFLNAEIPAREVVNDPVQQIKDSNTRRHAQIRQPAQMFEGRVNSPGVDFGDRADLKALESVALRTLCNTPDTSTDYDAGQINAIFLRASAAQPKWNDIGVATRAAIIKTLAKLILRDRDHLLWLLVHEAKKTLVDAISELREAEDFCRYYANIAQQQFTKPQTMPGPTGESNILHYAGRGVFICISPWNFPLAIYVGQIVAALVTGNSVIAKPAQQTPQIALAVSKLILEAGVPEDVYHCLPGGRDLGAMLVEHKDVSGVAFTGSTAAAWLINQTLANKRAAIVPFIAETGGQNALLVDSTALPEQVADAVIESAFNSAGQRCSALRILFVQEDIANSQLDLIRGAMAELKVGDPALASTDVGPIIDQQSLMRLQAHIDEMREAGLNVYQLPIPDELQGAYLSPTLIELDSLSQLDGEKFGPILHVVRFPADGFENALMQIAQLGYGLTVGLHSRIDSRVQLLQKHFLAGNTYINRNITGAVVGTQPFGGNGLSGTGPKAGGPNYLHRFVHEHTLSINTMASGGNVDLLRQG